MSIYQLRKAEEKITVMKSVLALDVGTTSLKGMLFDSDGRSLGEHTREYELIKQPPDIIELDPETYWTAAREVIRAILEKSRINPADIAAIGVTSQAESVTVLDADGRPLRRTIVWLDNRSRDEAAEIARHFSLDEVYRVTGQQEISPTWTATRMLWLMSHEPGVSARARHYLLVEDYLIYRLTGKIVTDRALNPSTLYFDITTGEWWPKMLTFLGLHPGQLPRLMNSGELVGTLGADAARETGLSPKTVVTPAPMDQIAGALGAGNIAPGMISETTGAALAICAATNKPLYDPHKRLGLYRHSRPGSFVLLPWVPTAGMVLRWFRDEFGNGLDYDALCREAESVAPGADGLIMLPHLSGAGCPEFDPKIKGVFWGVTLGHKRAHFTRAILEAIAFVLRSNLELLADLGISSATVRSLGGASRNDFWMQIKADVCARDFLLMECDETTCLGTAMLACVAIGLHPNLETACAAMVRVKKTVRPAPAMTAQYDVVYRQYLKLNQEVKVMF